MVQMMNVQEKTLQAVSYGLLRIVTKQVHA
jgi:hypothetical protein